MVQIPAFLNEIQRYMGDDLTRMIEKQLRRRGVRDARVLDAMARVPRHRFVPAEDRARAYGDHALPIAEGQTISQPYVVARMTELLAVQPDMNVLEVGTGSGYQTAILAVLGARVVSIERYPVLAEQARRLLGEVVPGAMVEVIVGDGTLGSPGHAPFDRIVVTAAAPDVPEPHRRQLADGGRIVVPIGNRRDQVMMVIDRRGERFIETPQFPCRFVPLVGVEGWDELTPDD